MRIGNLRGGWITLAAVAGVTLALAGVSGCGPDSGGGKTPPPPPSNACSGQGLIAIDPVANVGYAPIYTLDASGNAQLTIVDLTVGAANPVMGEVSLPGSDQPMATTYDSINRSVLALGLDTTNSNLTVYDISTKNHTVTSTIPITGITGYTNFGGIVMDSRKKRAFVAGDDQVGILNAGVNPPKWDATSVVDVSKAGSFFDSFSVNIATGIMFISGDGRNAIIDTTKTPLAPQSFESSFGTTDGTAFDPATNMMLLSNEVSADRSWAFNFATLQTATSPASADNVAVPGLGELAPLGEGPGGMTVINCTTHQGAIADEFGQNFKLIHLPTAPISGAPDNNGQPGSGTTADANSAYTIAAALIPKGTVDKTATQLGMVGDPNSLSIDPKHNLMYALADTEPFFHSWDPGSTTPLFLIQVDLSSPVLGASPTGGVDGKTFWTPTATAIPLP